MKDLSFEAQTALANISAGLRRARLLRGDSQKLAADRLGTSLATYRRLESERTEDIAGIAVSVVLEALCTYGFQSDVLALGDPARDARAMELTTRLLPKAGRGAATRRQDPR